MNASCAEVQGKIAHPQKLKLAWAYALTGTVNERSSGIRSQTPPCMDAMALCRRCCRELDECIFQQCLLPVFVLPLSTTWSFCMARMWYSPAESDPDCNINVLILTDAML